MNAVVEVIVDHTDRLTVGSLLYHLIKDYTHSRTHINLSAQPRMVIANLNGMAY